MYTKVDTLEQVEKYIQAQQDKINSWLPFDDLLIPFKIVDQDEQKKIDTIRMVLKMLLINTKDVLKGLVALETSRNVTASMILCKTLIENTIYIAYTKYFYITKEYESFENILGKNYELYIERKEKQVKEKADLSFEQLEGKNNTKIYLQYKDTCAIAHPNFKQLIHLLSNHDEKFSEEKLLTFNVNDNIFEGYEIDNTAILKNELLYIIDEKLNEIAEEVVLKYNQDIFNVSSKLGKITMSPNQEILDMLNNIK